MKKEITTQQSIVDRLRSLPEDTVVLLTIEFFNKSLQENSVIAGNWKDYSYAFDAWISWRRAKLSAEYMSTTEVIDLLENKTIETLDDSDFPSLDLIETSDGSTDFSSIDWLPELSDEDQDEAPSAWDLYSLGDITDNFYEFGPGSISKIKIEAADYCETLEYEDI